MQTFLTWFFIDIRFTEAPKEIQVVDEPAVDTFQIQAQSDESSKIEQFDAEVIQSSGEQSNHSNLIKEEVRRIKNVKVSTGCGPSPDREIEEIFANENVEVISKSFTPLREIPSRSSRVSIGTSPPPQSISTQVTTPHQSPEDI